MLLLLKRGYYCTRILIKYKKNIRTQFMRVQQIYFIFSVNKDKYFDCSKSPKRTISNLITINEHLKLFFSFIYRIHK